MEITHCHEFKWINPSQIEENAQQIILDATPKSDFFCNPMDGSVIATAPFLYTEVKGDFSIKAKVTPAFISTYDACALMVFSNERLWLKTAFENTDFGTHAVVTVATNEFSDDANGCNIENESVFLKIIRKKQAFACHYSLDGKTYRMIRILHLPMPETVKVGISVQSPLGNGGKMCFSDFELTEKIPIDIRRIQ